MLNQYCDLGYIKCTNCKGMIHCNRCQSIHILGESEVEIFGYDLPWIYCYEGCNAIIHAYRVGNVICAHNCTMTLNAYEANSTSCLDNCKATVRVPHGVQLGSCPDDNDKNDPNVTCNMTASYHSNFTEFCLNSGYMFPAQVMRDGHEITTQQFIAGIVKLGVNFQGRIFPG